MLFLFGWVEILWNRLGMEIIVIRMDVKYKFILLIMNGWLDLWIFMVVDLLMFIMCIGV